MITLGDEGFGLPGGSSYPYGTSEGVDFVKNLGIKNLDFGTFHMYPGSWGVPNTFGPGWIKDHAAACKAAGKPCFLEECKLHPSPDTRRAANIVLRRHRFQSLQCRGPVANRFTQSPRRWNGRRCILAMGRSVELWAVCERWKHRLLRLFRRYLHDHRPCQGYQRTVN